ncbi:uncharacterized protein CXQ87_001132 [Candidozyma duobushaemuli]|uniref:N-acetylglucosamine-induced protein 1 n=1 Tax=Candidozyma duobushaemuli TaxID=1231522 RepID=A0A2V1AKM9_9ASCO|nr:uncharacterized protein CXQ87_001132 [[Candida] duobushaemulonis]PVH18214.1 hypothetical protein CXQ87_001132 [[Candida] duobushaemulonis]
MTSTLTIQPTRIPVTVIHSPDMPSASKVSERPYTWPEVKDIVRYNDLDAYLAFKRLLKQQNSTVFRHIVTQTLGWRRLEELDGVKDDKITVEASGDPIFTNPDDLKIVRNDFPYYFEDDVTHLCVWTKKKIESDPNSSIGDLSQETRNIIERYVDQTFNLVWFRNWEALQSVKEISHVHVVVKGMTREQVAQVLGTPGIPLKA